MKVEFVVNTMLRIVFVLFTLALLLHLDFVMLIHFTLPALCTDLTRAAISRIHFRRERKRRCALLDNIFLFVCCSKIDNNTSDSMAAESLRAALKIEKVHCLCTTVAVAEMQNVNEV